MRVAERGLGAQQHEDLRAGDEVRGGAGVHRCLEAAVGLEVLAGLGEAQPEVLRRGQGLVVLRVRDERDVA